MICIKFEAIFQNALIGSINQTIPKRFMNKPDCVNNIYNCNRKYAKEVGQLTYIKAMKNCTHHISYYLCLYPICLATILFWFQRQCHHNPAKNNEESKFIKD